MDVSQYMPMFLAEAREHLQELNLAVVRIEEQPNDRETVGEIFRIAHSLKGMSATMGFENVAALTHEMESVFELLRENQSGLDREAITILLSCLDALEGAMESIAADGEERLDPPRSWSAYRASSACTAWAASGPRPRRPPSSSRGARRPGRAAAPARRAGRHHADALRARLPGARRARRPRHDLALHARRGRPRRLRRQDDRHLDRQPA